MSESGLAALRALVQEWDDEDKFSPGGRRIWTSAAAARVEEVLPLIETFVRERLDATKQRNNAAIDMVDTWLMEAEDYDLDKRLIPTLDLLRLRQTLAGAYCTCDEAVDDHEHCHHIGECCHCDCYTKGTKEKQC